MLKPSSAENQIKDQKEIIQEKFYTVQRSEASQAEVFNKKILTVDCLPVDW